MAADRSFVLCDATLLLLDDEHSVVRGDLWVQDGHIAGVGHVDAPTDVARIDAAGDIVMPGLVQAHIHLCQTLFRHEAEERTLLSWLRERIWPLEGAHTEHSLAVSARLGIAELLRSGTTCLLDMGTVHHQPALSQAIADSGIRAAFGKAMMDAGEGVPGTLLESTRDSLDASLEEARRWHGADDDRLRYAFAPRFVLSCTPELQQEVGRLSREHGYLIHTHAAEQREEIELVQRLTGRRNIDHLDDLGLCSPRSVFAHGVHLEDPEVETLARTGTSICHCPSSNLKLGSGVADPLRLLRAGVNVAIGADGAPCNNGLDAFVEMRLAHLLQCERVAPGALDPRTIVAMATRGGAEALGWSDRIGRLVPGYDADIIRVRRDDWRLGLDNDPYTELVCAGTRDLVRDVWVRGRQLLRDGELTTIDADRLLPDGRAALRGCLDRALG